MRLSRSATARAEGAHVLELEARDLAGEDRVRVLEHAFAEGAADVPHHLRREAGLAEHVPRPGRGGRLAVGAGDGEDRARAPPGRPAPAREITATPRRGRLGQKRDVGADAGALDQKIELVQQLRIVRTEAQDRARRPRARAPPAACSSGRRRSNSSTSQPRASRSRAAPTPERASPSTPTRGAGPRGTMPSGPSGQAGPLAAPVADSVPAPATTVLVPSYCSLTVLSVTRASRIPTIQKRTTTRVSGQPRSSK